MSRGKQVILGMKSDREKRRISRRLYRSLSPAKAGETCPVRTRISTVHDRGWI